MLKLYTPKAAERVICKYKCTVDAVAARYALPAPFINALLYTELVRIDLFDPVADFVVLLNHRFGTSLLGKRDSSTGFGQIFGFVAVNAPGQALAHQHRQKEAWQGGGVRCHLPARRGTGTPVDSIVYPWTTTSNTPL